MSADTIIAISSATGHGARTILRLSGPDAHRVAATLCPDWHPAPARVSRHRLTLDPGLSFPIWLYSFVSPRSYTGDDLVELHLPGNDVLARLVLDRCLALGARPADPGEFTARAYFNGRLDLTEAEGVAAAVAATSEGELRAARQLMAGELARRLRPMMDQVAETLALVEVGIDFSDEDVTFLAHADVARRAAAVERDLATLAGDSDRLERLSAEPTIVLVGRPNAGKSTLLNALAGHARAVVSPTPGTTRDVLSAEIPLPRGLARLQDVAGLEDLPDTASDIDRAMRRRALEAVAAADLVVLAIDSTDPRPPIPLPRAPDLTVLTKSDLGQQQRGGHAGLAVSAHTGAGLDALRSALDALAFGRSTASHQLALNRRHLRNIDDARAALSRCITAASNPHTGPELLALDLREALDSLGHILGSLSPDDVLSLVFSRFCIGK